VLLLRHPRLTPLLHKVRDRLGVLRERLPATLSTHGLDPLTGNSAQSPLIGNNQL
jgi:hypothetical protein